MCNPAALLVAIIHANRRNDQRAAARALTRLAALGYQLVRGREVPAPPKSTR